MDALQPAALAAIEASLTYLDPSSEPPVAYAYEPPPGVPQRSGRSAAHRVTIRDGRPIAGGLSLDREGFVLRPHVSQVVDFYDAEAVKRLYYPEIEALLRAETGAESVVIFDHTVRNTATGSQSSRRIREAGAHVHNDYTEASAARRVRDLLPFDEAAMRLQRRFAEINVWRPIAGPVQSWPLALSDARTLDRRDLVVAERRYPDRVGETYVVKFNPRHQWFYFPQMRRNEVLLIKCFDSATDGRSSFAVHSAFDDPTTPAGAPPRESIEIRAFVFF